MDNHLMYSHLGVVANTPEDAYDEHLRMGAKLYAGGRANEGAQHYQAAHHLTGGTGKRDRAHFDHVRKIKGAKLMMGHPGTQHHVIVPQINDLIRQRRHHEAADLLASRIGIAPNEALQRVAARHREMGLPPEDLSMPSAQPTAADIIAQIEAQGATHAAHAHAILSPHYPHMSHAEGQHLARYLHNKFPVLTMPADRR